MISFMRICATPPSLRVKGVPPSATERREPVFPNPCPEHLADRMVADRWSRRGFTEHQIPLEF